MHQRVSRGSPGKQVTMRTETEKMKHSPLSSAANGHVAPPLCHSCQTLVNHFPESPAPNDTLTAVAVVENLRFFSPLCFSQHLFDSSPFIRPAHSSTHTQSSLPHPNCCFEKRFTRELSVLNVSSSSKGWGLCTLLRIYSSGLAPVQPRDEEQCPYQCLCNYY